MKKRMVCLLSALLLAAAGCAQAERLFVDSLGREVAVDQEITRVAVSGPAAQIVVFALAPDKLVGLSGEWDEGAQQFLDEKYAQLPVLGQLYGGKGEMNLETLLSAAPQVVIDVGEPKKGAAQDLDDLSAQTGIPFVHITAHIGSMDETYAELGRLLGMEEEAKTLSAYCRMAYDRAAALAQSVEKVNMLYVAGEEGLSVIARDSYHSEVIDMMANNLAVVDAPSSRGTGNEVDMEQILLWNPEVVIFSNTDMYDEAASDPLWQSVDAIRNGRYYVAPVGPDHWLGFPPSVQRLLGMMWMGALLYPQAADYDLYEETARYFELFYHCELSRAQYDELMIRSLSR